MSTGTLFGNKTWSRTGTTVTVTATAHGLTAGDYIVVRGGSDTYLYVTISNVSTNAFDFTSGTSGTASGSDLAYIPAAKITNYGPRAADLEVASAGNIQINSMTITRADQFTTVFDLTCPSDIENGSGENGSQNLNNIPIVAAFKMDTGQQISNVAIEAPLTSPFNEYKITQLAQDNIINLIRLQF